MERPAIVDDIIRLEPVSPNMIRDVVHQAFETSAGPVAVTNIMGWLPMNIFIKGVEAIEIEEDRETARAVFQNLIQLNGTATDEHTDTRAERLNAALARVAPPPFRPAENVPEGNYWTERRALNNPRPADQVLPIDFLPGQLTSIVRQEKYGREVRREDVPALRAAVSVGSGWRAFPWTVLSVPPCNTQHSK